MIHVIAKPQNSSWAEAFAQELRPIYGGSCGPLAAKRLGPRLSGCCWRLFITRGGKEPSRWLRRIAINRFLLL